ncbi:hypothetical protein RFI_39272 [Reticulomyxa filosa]|uniref:Uncharacterized protein n=1 Tax=Reticulomyxa filosa TaxID=46433 RepID=X6L9M7_RETFI|nr:hypothetical protein RFI_39272 [Reticulomyxa filosa]|eukprot:ETN98238.1 hypothetical protein RFI_39272 [Reticulomyxa filosa]
MFKSFVLISHGFILYTKDFVVLSTIIALLLISFDLFGVSNQTYSIFIGLFSMFQLLSYSKDLIENCKLCQKNQYQRVSQVQRKNLHKIVSLFILLKIFSFFFIVVSIILSHIYFLIISYAVIFIIIFEYH